MRYQKSSKQSGAVSIFVVVFTALLFVAVSVGFITIIISGQNQTTDNDLAQSALDSAHAGAEDAKRVLAQYTDCQERNIQDTDDCQRIIKAIDDPNQPCETVNYALSLGSGERPVQQSESDKALEQAYTCVRVTPNTPNYVGKTRSDAEGGIRIIPLKSVADYDVIQIRWLKDDDDMSYNNPGDTPDFSLLPKDSDQPDGFLKLPSRSDWLNDDRGALLRVGSLQYDPGNIDLLDMDDNARAVFLYSSRLGATNTAQNPIDMATVDLHLPLPPVNQDRLVDASPNKPIEADCNATGETRAAERGAYMCVSYLRLPRHDNGSLFNYLTIASVYRDVSFEVSLMKVNADPLQDPEIVRFKNVQPEIDATGRANNVFRRIVSRVESADANQAPYPRAAVGSRSNVCKNFLVTDDPDDYKDDNSEIPGCPNIANPPPGAEPSGIATP